MRVAIWKTRARPSFKFHALDSYIQILVDVRAGGSLSGPRWDSSNGNSSDTRLCGIVCVCVCDPATTTKTNADTRHNQSHRKVRNGRR